MIVWFCNLLSSFSDRVCLSFMVNISFCHHLTDIHLYKFFTSLGVNKICLSHSHIFQVGLYTFIMHQCGSI